MTDCQRRERSHRALEKSTVHGQAPLGTNGWLIMFCCILYLHPFWRHWLRKIRRTAVFSRKERMFPYMTCYRHSSCWRPCHYLSPATTQVPTIWESGGSRVYWEGMAEPDLPFEGSQQQRVTSDVIHHSCLYCLSNWCHTIWQTSLGKEELTLAHSWRVQTIMVKTSQRQHQLEVAHHPHCAHG